MRCYRTPIIDYAPWRYVGSEEPAEDVYDSVCKTCFRLSVGEAAAVAQSEALCSDEEFTSEESLDPDAEGVWPTADPRG